MPICVIAAMTVASIPFGAPTGQLIRATVVLSAAAEIAAQVGKHRLVRPRLGYLALTVLILSAVIVAVAPSVFTPGTQLPVTPACSSPA